MKRKLAPKDVWVLTGVSGVLLLPLAVIGKIRSQPAVAQQTSFRDGVVSPDGMHLATLEQPPKGASPFVAFDLVVRSLPEGEEKVRMPFHMSQARVRWSSTGQYIALSGSEAAFLDFSAGARVSSEKWGSGNQTYSRPTLELRNVANPPFGVGNKWWLLPDSDLMLAHKDSEWKATEISTNTIHSFNGVSEVQQKRLTNFWGSQEPRPSLPVRGKITPPRIQISTVEAEPFPTPVPGPTPTPTTAPTPIPTSTPTPALRQFLKEEAARNEELSEIVAKLDGDPAPSTEESARLNARAQELLAAARKARAKVPAHLLNPPAARQPRINPVVRRSKATISLYDFQYNKTLWETALTYGHSTPEQFWTPDGRYLVLGTNIPTANTTSGPRQRFHITVLDGTTGRRISSWTTASPATPKIWFSKSLKGRWRTVVSNYDNGRNLFTAYDILTGQMAGQWMVTPSTETEHRQTWFTNESASVFVFPSRGEWIVRTTKDFQVIQ